VEEAHSGPHVIARAAVLRPDLIVLDFSLEASVDAQNRPLIDTSKPAIN
jgi:hypothetical protein